MTLRDLQHRGRQFGIAVGGAALVFAVTLLLTGILAGFETEAESVVGAQGADAWVVPDGVPGPYTTRAPLSPEQVEAVSRAEGIDEAHALVVFSGVARASDGNVEWINLLGHDAGPPGDPTWGAPPSDGRGAVVDERMGVDVGETLVVAGQRLKVAEVVEGRTSFGGRPIVSVPLRQAQDIAFSGRPLANAVLVRGDTSRLPEGTNAISLEAAGDDMQVPLEGAVQVIDTLRYIMWLVAALIIGAVIYLSALERIRDFAVLKAVGGSTRTLAASLAAQAALAALTASIIGAGVAALLKPAFPVPVTLELSALLVLPLIATAVGLLSSIAALRRVVRVDPALAFAS